MPYEPCLLDFAPQDVSEWSLKRDAKKADISIEAAIEMKERYAILACEIWAEIFEPYYWRWFDTIVKLKEIKRRIKLPQPEDTITESMIEQAREVPITSVIDFNKGKAFAWCHEDKRPSLTYMNKTNKAWCPACGKYFDAIKTLMERDGMQFPQAIKYLCS